MIPDFIGYAAAVIFFGSMIALIVIGLRAGK